MSKYLKQLLNEVKTKDSWRQDELVNKINSKMTEELEDLKRHAPGDVQVGDVTIVDLHKIPHPAVVLKVSEDTCTCVITSTTEGPHCVYKITNVRGFNPLSWATSTTVDVSKEEVLKRWKGEIFSKSQVKEINSALKQHYKNKFKAE